MAQPLRRLRRRRRASRPRPPRCRAARTPRVPGRTRLFTRQPASRNASRRGVAEAPAGAHDEDRFLHGVQPAASYLEGCVARWRAGRRGAMSIRMASSCRNTSSDRDRRGGGRAGARPVQHDARRLAQHVAEADAAARAAAVRRHHHHHGDDLDDGRARRALRLSAGRHRAHIFFLLGLRLLRLLGLFLHGRRRR